MITGSVVSTTVTALNFILEYIRSILPQDNGLKVRLDKNVIYNRKLSSFSKMIYFVLIYYVSPLRHLFYGQLRHHSYN